MPDTTTRSAQLARQLAQIKAATAATNARALRVEADLATLKLGAAYSAAVLLRHDPVSVLRAGAGQPEPAVLTGSAHWEIRYDDGTVLEVRARKDTP